MNEFEQKDFEAARNCADLVKTDADSILAIFDNVDQTMKLLYGEAWQNAIRFVYNVVASSFDIPSLDFSNNENTEYLEQIAPFVTNTKTVIMDLCGTKKQICARGFELAAQYCFTFVGGHPMAGKQYSGIKYAKETLFKNAPMVLVPAVYDDIYFLARVKKLLEPAMFGRITVTTAEEHDAMIAFTSQLAHVVSNAYVKSPTAQNHKGFSAGSYKDMTRVAWLNEYMWTELFLENKEPLLFEIDTIIKSLTEYRDAILSDDADTLRGLLRDGRIAKEKVDG